MSQRDIEIRIKADRTAAQQAAQEELRDLQRVTAAHRQADAEKVRGDARTAENAKRESRSATDHQVRDVHRLRDERGRFVAQAIQQDRSLADQATKSWGGISGGISGATGMLRGYMGQAAGLAGINNVLQLAAQEWERIAHAAERAGDVVTDRRGSIRQLAALKGQAGETLRTEVEQLQLRQVTLQSRDEAMAMQLGMVGTGDPLMREGRIRPDQFQKLSERIGAWQAMTGYDAGQTGAFAGLLPMMLGATTQNPLQADSAFAEFNKINEMLQMSGADAGTLMAALTKDVSLLESGAFRTIQEQAAVYGALGTVKGAGTSESANQLVRATVGSLGRMRGSQLMEGLTDADYERRGEYLAGIGAGEQHSTLEIADMVAADMAAQKAAKGEAFNPRTYLAAKGFGGSIHDMDALISYATVQETLKSTYMPIANRQANIADAMAPINRFQQADPFAIQRRAGVTEEMATVISGAGGPELANQMVRATFERMRASGEAAGTFDEYTSGPLGRIRLNELYFRAAFDANQQLPKDQQDWNFGGVGGIFDPASRNRRLGRMGMGVLQQGGTPGGDWAGTFGGEAVQGVVDAIERQTALIERGEKPLAAKPEPVPQPLRPPAPGNAGGPLNN